MSIADAVPCMRVQYRGPAFNNPLVIESFIGFLAKQKEEKFSDIKPYLSSPDKIGHIMLYLEGSLMVYT